MTNHRACLQEPWGVLLVKSAAARWSRESSSGHGCFPDLAGDSCLPYWCWQGHKKSQLSPNLWSYSCFPRKEHCVFLTNIWRELFLFVQKRRLCDCSHWLVPQRAHFHIWWGISEPNVRLTRQLMLWQEQGSMPHRMNPGSVFSSTSSHQLIFLLSFS